MRLGFDLDGTVADMQTALARVARDLFPGVDPAALPRSTAATSEGVSPRSPAGLEAPISTKSLTSSQQRELWKAVATRVNFWETLDEIEPGGIARLYRMAVEHRWEIIFLTSRPETAGDTAQTQSHRWLAAHGFLSPSVFVVHGSRGKIAKALALDVIVDDRPENCVDVVVDSDARAILVGRGDEDAVPGSARQLGIGAVSSLDECLDILDALDPPAPDPSGIVERFKRLLGLKPQTVKRTKAGQTRSTGNVSPSRRVLPTGK